MAARSAVSFINDIELWQLDRRIAVFEAAITRTSKEAGHGRPPRAQGPPEMTEEGKGDKGLFSLLGQVFGGRNPKPEVEPIAAAEPQDAPTDSQKEAEEFKPSEPTAATRKMRTISADHLQNLILAAFQKIEGFPKDGVSITVYGLRPWNVMITFAPGSASFQNATMYREMLPQIVAKLREEFFVE
jgi:hypothetical protein